MSNARDNRTALQQRGRIRGRTFQPPESSLIDQFSRNTCRALAELDGESGFDLEVISGFSNFVKLMAKVKSKELNGEIGSFD